VESVADTLSIFQTNPNMHPNKVACLEQTSPKFLRPPRVHFDPVHVEWMVSRSYDLGNPCISMWYIRTYSYTYYIIPPIWKKSEYPKQHITSRSLDEGRYTDIYIWAIYNIILFMLLKGSINPLAIQLYPEAGQYGSQSVGESGRWGASRFFPLGIWGWSIHQLFGVPRVPGFWPITIYDDLPSKNEDFPELRWITRGYKLLWSVMGWVWLMMVIRIKLDLVDCRVGWINHDDLSDRFGWIIMRMWPHWNDGL
jgi:hypothetical protein